MYTSVYISIQDLLYALKSAKKKRYLFGSGLCTEFGILISSRKVLKKSAIGLVLGFIQILVFLFHDEKC